MKFKLPFTRGSSPIIGLWSGVKLSGPQTVVLIPTSPKRGHILTAPSICLSNVSQLRSYNPKWKSFATCNIKFLYIVTQKHIINFTNTGRRHRHITSADGRGDHPRSATIPTTTFNHRIALHIWAILIFHFQKPNLDVATQSRGKFLNYF